jgi:hypothetical protein
MVTSENVTDWAAYCRDAGALWQFNNPALPHVKTSMSGDHVSAYFNSDIIASQPETLDRIVSSVFVPQLESNELQPDWVITYDPMDYSSPTLVLVKLELNAATPSQKRTTIQALA